MNRARIVTTAALVAALSAALAPATAGRTGEPQRPLGGKLKLLAGMVQDSPAARRIASATEPCVNG